MFAIGETRNIFMQFLRYNRSIANVVGLRGESGEDYNEGEYGRTVFPASVSYDIFDSAVQKLCIIADFLDEENKKFNLTAHKTVESIVLYQFIDCLPLISFVFDRKTLCDVGSGAGFPAIVLAAFLPELKVTALEATGKKADFIFRAAKAAELGNVSVLNVRAEECSLRESFDAVTARAVAAMPVLSELCMPLVRVGGIFVPMKGAESENAKAAEKLGGKLESRVEYLLRGVNEDAARMIYVIKKLSPTPAGYPRRYSLIKSKPL